MSLINRESLQTVFEKECVGECGCCKHAKHDPEGCALIDNAPAVDAKPVRHGRWIPEIVDCIETVFKCSECCRLVEMTNDYCYKASKYASHTYPYCHCGAKMDAEVEA